MRWVTDQVYVPVVLTVLVKYFVFVRLWFCKQMVEPLIWYSPITRIREYTKAYKFQSVNCFPEKRGKSCDPFMESAGNCVYGKCKPDVRPLTIINITDFAKGNLLLPLESELEYLINSLLMFPKSTNPIRLPVFLSNTSISSNSQPIKFLWFGNFACSYSWWASENPAPVEIKSV